MTPMYTACVAASAEAASRMRCPACSRSKVPPTATWPNTRGCVLPGSRAAPEPGHQRCDEFKMLAGRGALRVKGAAPSHMANHLRLRAASIQGSV